MKYLTPRIVKILLMLSSLITLALSYILFLEFGSLAVSILSVFLIHILLIIFYLQYVSNVIWINENIETLRSSINIDRQNVAKHFNQTFDRINQIERNTNSHLEVIKSYVSTTNASVSNNFKSVLGLEGMLIAISNENELFRNKLLTIISQNKSLSDTLKEGNQQVIKYLLKLSEIEQNLKMNLADNHYQYVELLKNLGKEIDLSLDKSLDHLNLLRQQIELEIGLSSNNFIEKTFDLVSSISNSIGQTDLSIKNLKDLSLHGIEEIKKDHNTKTIKIENEISQIKNQANFNYNRIDALFSVHQLIKLRSPLPIMHDWAISSDYAHALIRILLQKDKGDIIDIGSGISTVILGYIVEQKSLGKVISLEHDYDYYIKTKNLIAEHNLENVVDIIHCPLVEVSIKNEVWKWYDLQNVKIENDIALVSIDGPPGNIQKFARYPAVPLLKPYLNKNTTILLDDGGRPEETEIAKKWALEEGLKMEYLHGFKGIYKFEL